MAKSQNQNGGKEKWYAKRLWNSEDGRGCKLKLVFHWKDREDPEEFEMELSQVSIFNATTWATEPKPQFYRLVFRRAIDVLRPGLLAGVRHIDDLVEEETIEMKEINPRLEKDGNAGLDAFAGATAPKETVVEDGDAQQQAGDQGPASEPAAPQPQAAGDHSLVLAGRARAQDRQPVSGAACPSVRGTRRNDQGGGADHLQQQPQRHRRDRPRRRQYRFLAGARGSARQEEGPEAGR
jgi:hypothetical protein